jgi:phenylalanyl-tRNA synthetase beta chain
MGFSEAVTPPMLAPVALERVGIDPKGLVEITNSLRAEESILRPSLLPGLLSDVAYNAGLGLNDVALFETGHVFLPPTAETQPLPDERDHLGVVLAGIVARAPVEPDRPVDAYDTVDALRGVVDALELDDVRLVSGNAPGYAAGRGSAIVVDGETVGHVGELDAAVLRAAGVTAPAAALELRLDALWTASRRDRTFTPLSRFPSSGVDLAFVIAERVLAADVESTLREAAGDVLESLRVFDEFRGEALGEGRRSVAFALRFRAPDRTLTDAEVGELRRRAIDAVVAAHGAELRG